MQPSSIDKHEMKFRSILDATGDPEDWQRDQAAAGRISAGGQQSTDPGVVAGHLMKEAAN
jgi:hypothetical protein